GRRRGSRGRREGGASGSWAQSGARLSWALTRRRSGRAPTHRGGRVPVRLVAFDLDDTLTPSKSPIAPEMASALSDLLAVTQVCIISGGQLAQFTEQVTERLDLDAARLARLHLMPTCGTRYYRHDGAGWAAVYAHDLTAAERADA